MERTLVELLPELDDSLIPLGRNKVYTDNDGKNARVIIPEQSVELGMFDPPTRIHIGTLPFDHESLEEGEGESLEEGEGESSEEGEGESPESDDINIPYMVLAKYDKWIREDTNDVIHRKTKKLPESRALSLGVYFVPETSTADVPTGVPEPHRCEVGETITFWVRPREWRENNFMYMIRKGSADSLLEVLASHPDEVLESAIAEDEESINTDTVAHDESVAAGGTAEASGKDDDIRSDGGWSDSEMDLSHSSRDQTLSLVIDGVTTTDTANIEEWNDTGYLVAVGQNRAIKTDLMQDLLGESEQVQRVLPLLGDERSVHPIEELDYVDELVVRQAVFRSLLDNCDLHEEAPLFIVVDGAISNLPYDFSGRSQGDSGTLRIDARQLLGHFEQADVIDREVGWDDDDSLSENISLNVRPSAIHAALYLADNTDST